MIKQSPFNGGNGISQRSAKCGFVFVVLFFVTNTVFFHRHTYSSTVPLHGGLDEAEIFEKTIRGLRKELRKQQLDLDELRRQQMVFKQQQQQHGEAEEAKVETLETYQLELERTITDRLEKAEARVADAIESYRVESLRANASHLAVATTSTSAEKQETQLKSGLEVELGIIDDYTDAASTVAFSNTTTVALKGSRFYSGFRNHIMAFTTMVLQAQLDGHGQILLNSLYEKDTYGSNKDIPFWRLWDVPHWNSHYPQLPRLVRHDPVLHDQWDPISREYFYDAEAKKFKDSGNVTLYDEPTRPFISDKQHKMFGAYSRYSRGMSKRYNTNGHRHPTEILMLQGAMRPHPKLRDIIDGLVSTLDGGNKTTADSTSKPFEYLTLHARVEPDMQKHTMCPDKKVLRLKEIFDWMQKEWPQPPVSCIFMPINREYLEDEGSEAAVERLTHKNKTDKINWIAVDNLRELNKARDEGLWQGHVKVVEFGSKALEDTEYRDRPSTTGALINFFISIGAKIFIGTEVSSYSHDILATRFVRKHMENYKYLPDGLHHWTPPGLEDPPGFAC